MKFSIPKKATVNIKTACYCGLTVATPIEIYEPAYVEALEAENSRLREALEYAIEMTDYINTRDTIQKKARAALEGK